MQERIEMAKIAEAAKMREDARDARKAIVDRRWSIGQAIAIALMTATLTVLVKLITE